MQARELGPDGKGIIAYAVIALSMVLTATDGLSGAVLLQAGRDRRPLNRVHGAMLRVVCTISVPSVAVALSLGIVLPSQRPLIAAAAAIPFALYAQGARGILLAAGAAGAIAWQGSITTIFLSVALILALVAWHIDSYQALMMWFGAQALAAAYTATIIRRMIKRGVVVHDTTTPTLGELVREQFHFGMRTSAATLAGYVNLRIDVFLISALLGPRLLGIYTLAVSVGELLWSVSLPVVYAALERIAGDPFGDAAALAARLMRNVIALQVFFGVIAFIVGPRLLVLLYGPAFSEAGTVLRILLPGLVVYAVEAFLGYFILVQLQRPMLLFAIQTTSAVLCAGITLATLSRFGIIGAAAATSLTYLGVVAFKSVYFKRKTGIGFREQWLLSESDIRAMFRRLPRMSVGCVR